VAQGEDPEFKPQYHQKKICFLSSQVAPLLMNGLRNVVFIYNGILFIYKEE
jgi:hypothetical protein